MDQTVAATCETILNTIRSSGLNWNIQESPFSLSISIRKSFVKVIEKPACSPKPNPEISPISSHQNSRKTFPKKPFYESPQYISQINPLNDCTASSPTKYPTQNPMSLSTTKSMCPTSYKSNTKKMIQLFPDNSAQPSPSLESPSTILQQQALKNYFPFNSTLSNICQQ